MLEKFTWYKQSAYKWKGEGITVYIDPWGLGAQEEPADVIFITHAHSDHFEPTDIEKIRKLRVDKQLPIHGSIQSYRDMVKTIRAAPKAATD